jgi:hypothetical protein
VNRVMRLWQLLREPGSISVGGHAFDRCHDGATPLLSWQTRSMRSVPRARQLMLNTSLAPRAKDAFSACTTRTHTIGLRASLHVPQDAPGRANQEQEIRTLFDDHDRILLSVMRLFLFDFSPCAARWLGIKPMAATCTAAPCSKVCM